MSVKLSSKLPEGEGNGLEAIVFDLEAGKLHVAVCIVSGKSGTTDYESGDKITTARLRRIEVILDDDDQKVAHRLMLRALQRRTGQETLPYDLEEEMRNVFEGFNPDVPDPDEKPAAGPEEQPGDDTASS